MLIGHQKQWQLLKKSAESGRFSHAYLFCGPEKIGKKTVALEWLSLIFGQNLKSQPHPDLTLISPEKETEGELLKSEIPIKEIRELIWKLSLKPYSAPLKAALIDQAQAMNQEAQTCLLKTLEEPRGKTILILITEYPESLLPTILSRCEIVKFYPTKKEEIKDYLKKSAIKEEEKEEIISTSLGRAGEVIEILADNQRIFSQKEKIKELIKLTKLPLALRFQYAKKLAEEPSSLRRNLDIWLNFFHQIFLKKLAGRDSSSQYSLNKIKEILKNIQTTKFLISGTNINPKLALEVLVMSL